MFLLANKSCIAFAARSPIATLLTAALLMATTAHSTPVALQPSMLQVRQLLAMPEGQIDLAQAEVTMERAIDPSTDADAALRQLDRMAAAVSVGLPLQASNQEKLDALRAYLYQPGPWNTYRPFQYDLDDPMGVNIHNKLLSNYLSTHKGNCVSMPLLVIILGQKLGLDVTAARAPLHLFVKYKDDGGKWINLEATGTASPTRDAWIRQGSPMSDDAIAKGVYMRPLSKKEVVVAMADTLVQYFKDLHQEDQILALTDLMLKYDPRNVEAMMYKSAAYFRLADREFFSKYSSPEAVPDKSQAHLNDLMSDFRRWQEKAAALGWRRPAAEEDEKYLQRVDAQKRSDQNKPQFMH